MVNQTWNLNRQPTNTAAHAEAGAASAKATRASAEVNALRQEVERLELACQAMWEINRECFGLDDEILLNKMEEIDLRDGTKDSKMSAQVTSCPSCGRRTNTRRSSCLYCGSALQKEHAFD